MKKYVVLILPITIFLILTLYKLNLYPGLNADEAWYSNKSIYIDQTSIIKNFKGMGNYTGIAVPGSIYLSHKIFGFNIFGTRITSVIYGLLTILTLYFFCYRYYSIYETLCILLLLSSSIFFVTYSRIAIQHVWIPFYLIFAYLCFYKFYTEKNKLFLFLSIISIGLALQVLTSVILFYVFMLSFYFKNVKIILKSKYFYIFSFVFLIVIASMFEYTSKIVIKIFGMNLDYIDEYGIGKIVTTFLSRIPLYIKSILLTFSGYRPLKYFSANIPENYFYDLIITIILLLPLYKFFRSKEIKDILLKRYLLITFCVTPFFYEFFNKNMHAPHLGEERYFFTFIPFLFIALVRGYKFLMKSKTKLIIFFILLSFFNIFRFVNNYIFVFEKYGGLYNQSYSEKNFSVGTTQHVKEIYEYLKFKIDLKNDVVIAPSFLLYQPLNFVSKKKIINLYYWPEKPIPKEWITDENYMPYKYCNIGLKKFFKVFSDRKIYFIVWKNLENKYLSRLNELDIKFELKKSFFRKNGEKIVELFEIIKNNTDNDFIYKREVKLRITN